MTKNKESQIDPLYEKDFTQMLSLNVKTDIKADQLKIGDIFSIDGRYAIFITQIDISYIKGLFVWLDASIAGFRDICLNVADELNPKYILILDQAPLQLLKTRLQALLYSPNDVEGLWEQSLFLLKHPKTKIQLIDSYEDGLYLWESAQGKYIAGPKLMSTDPRAQSRNSILMFYQAQKEELQREYTIYEDQRQVIQKKLAYLYESFEAWSEKLKKNLMSSPLLQALEQHHAEVQKSLLTLTETNLVLPDWLTALKAEENLILSYRSLSKKTKLTEQIELSIQVQPFEIRLDLQKAIPALKACLENTALMLYLNQEEIPAQQLAQDQWLFCLDPYADQLFQCDMLRLKILDQSLSIPLKQAD
jgi:hypothetical protein